METETNTPTQPTEAETVEQLIEGYGRIKAELGKTIIGQHDVIEEILIALFGSTLCLINDAPQGPKHFGHPFPTHRRQKQYFLTTGRFKFVLEKDAFFLI